MKLSFDSRLTGFLFGILGPFIGFWGVVLYFDAIENISFDALWNIFLISNSKQSAIISLSLIFNLFVFYAFLRLELNRIAMGIVLGTMMYIPVVLYLKFFA